MTDEQILKSPYDAWRHVYGDVMWRMLNGEPSYHLDKVEWERLFDTPYPYTKEEWEREIKGKSLFELMPKERYNVE